LLLPRPGFSEDRVREARETILATFRPLWKARQQRENDRLMKAVWWDEGEAWVGALMTMSRQLNSDEIPRPQFSAVLGVESAVDGPPTLRQFIRQCLLMNIIRPRLWDQAVLTRRDGAGESVVAIDLVAIAEGRQEAPEVRWGDVVSVPYKSGLPDAADLRVQGWAMGEARISLRLDLFSSGVISNRPAGAAPLWDCEPAPPREVALETVVRRAGVPRDLLNLGVTIHRVGTDGKLAMVPQGNGPPPRLRHGDIVTFTPPELPPWLSEEALRRGIWVCSSMDGPFWPVNTEVHGHGGYDPPLGYLLLALQAPHPGRRVKVDWPKAVVRTWVGESQGEEAAGEADAPARWVEQPLLETWAKATLRPGMVVVLPAGDAASAEMPPALVDGLSQLGFEWYLLAVTGPTPRTYQPRLFNRRLANGTVIWSDVRSDGPTGPVLPLARDLVAMLEDLNNGAVSRDDPTGGEMGLNLVAPKELVEWSRPKPPRVPGAQSAVPAE
jgi:hypothetical protein